MDGNLLPIIVGIIGIAIGFIIAKIIEKSKGKNLLNSTRKEASSIIKEAKIDAEAIKKDKILQAKEKFIELKSEHEKVVLSREKKISDVEKRIRDRESQVASEVDKKDAMSSKLLMLIVAVTLVVSLKSKIEIVALNIGLVSKSNALAFATFSSPVEGFILKAPEGVCAVILKLKVLPLEAWIVPTVAPTAGFSSKLVTKFTALIPELPPPPPSSLLHENVNNKIVKKIHFEVLRIVFII